MSDEHPRKILMHTPDETPQKPIEETRGFAVDASIADCPALDQALDAVIEHGLTLVMTSISLDELENIKMKKAYQSADAMGARHILKRFANNLTNPQYEKVLIERDYTYADDSILDYCRRHSLGLITSDMGMSIKAQMFQIPCIFLTKEDKDFTFDFTALTKTKIVPLTDVKWMDGHWFLDRSQETILFRKYIIEEGKCQKINSNDAFPIKDGLEILTLSYDKSKNDSCIHFAYHRLFDCLTVSPKAYELSNGYLPFDGLEQEKIVNASINPVLKFFYLTLYGYLGHQILNTILTEDKYYLSTREGESDFHFIIRENCIVNATTERAELFLGDTVFHVHFHEDDTIDVIWGNITITAFIATHNPSVYKTRIKLHEAENLIELPTQIRHQLFQQILSLKHPTQTRRVAPHTRLKKETLIAKSQLNVANLYLRVIRDSKMEEMDTPVELQYGSKIVILKNQQNGTWSVTAFKIIAPLETLNSIIYFQNVFSIEDYEDCHIKEVDEVIHEFIHHYGALALQEEKNRIAKEQKRLQKEAEVKKHQEEERKRNEEEAIKKKAEEEKKRKEAEEAKKLEELRKKQEQLIPVTPATNKISVNTPYTLNYVKYEEKTNRLYAASKLSSKYARLVYPLGSLKKPTAFDVPYYLSNSSHIIEIEVRDNHRYSLIEYTIISNLPKNHAKKFREFSGTYDGNSFESTKDSTLNRILADFLPQM